MTVEQDAGPAPPVDGGPPPPTVRGVARVVEPRIPTVRARARVLTGSAVRPASQVQTRFRGSAPVRPSRLVDPAGAAPPSDAVDPALRPAAGAGAAPRPTPRLAAADIVWQAGTELRSIVSESVEPATTAVPGKGFGRRLIVPLSAAAVAAFVAATGYLAVTDPRPDADVGRWAAPAPVTVAQQPAEVTGNTDPFGRPAPALTGAPTRLRVRAIGIDTSLESLRLAKDGALAPPASFAKAGWYADGTAPGDQGPAVITGHVDSKRGPAIFYKLREIQVGDKIEVARGGGMVRFIVVSTAWYPKTRFPVEQVYGPTPDRQLRLITCGGVFDHRLRSYTDNLVVYAVAG